MRWLLLLSVVLSCGKPSIEERALPPPSAGPSATDAHSVVEALSSPSSFELVARKDGLSLIWAAATPGAGWLYEAELDQRGRPSGAPRRHQLPEHPLGKVTDLVGAARHSQLLIGWLEQGEREARAQSVWLEPGRAPAALDLGPAALASPSARGNIALALEAERDGALLLWRGLEAPCAEPGATACTGFNFRRMTADGVETTGLPLAVPAPCATQSVHLATGPRRFHYGVCARRDRELITTLFTIQQEPEFARAEPLLPGCTPLGTVEASERAWLVGDCQGRRRASRVPLLDEAITTETLDGLRVSCTPRRLELAKGRFALELRGARAGLERVLPAELVPTGARAAYNGATVVVAYVADGRLATRALGCREGRLAPLR